MLHWPKHLPDSRPQGSAMIETAPDTVMDLSERLGSSWPPPLTIRSTGLTDPGRVRPRNEDQFLIASFSHALQVLQSSIRQPGLHIGGPQGHLFVVADGV